MTTQRVVAWLLVLGALGLPGCERGKTGETKSGETGKGGQALTASDRDSIHAYVARFDQKVLAGDWPAVVAFYSQDAILLPPNASEIRGQAAIRKFFEEFPKFTEFKQRVEEIEGDENYAYPRGTYDQLHSTGCQGPRQG